MMGYSEVFETLEMIVKCLKIGCKIIGLTALMVFLIYILWQVIKVIKEDAKEE